MILILSLVGLSPAAFFPKSVLPPTDLVPLAPVTLHLELDLHGGGGGALDDLGEALSDGIVLGELHLGVDGVPGSPFVSNFLHAHEVRIIRIDPETALSNLLLQVRVTLD